MGSKNHILYGIFFGLCVKSLRLTEEIHQLPLIFFLVAILLTCTLPDIDHQQSRIGRRVAYLFGRLGVKHRGFTHSAFVFLVIECFAQNNYTVKVLSDGFLQGILLGYFSHVLFDMFTPQGISLLWPINTKLKIETKKKIDIYFLTTCALFFFVQYEF